MKLEKLKNRLITENFPDLSEKDIEVVWAKLDDAFLETTFDTLGDSYYIEVDKTLKKASELVLIGGLAHELAHVSLELSRNIVWRGIEPWLLARFDVYETWDERQTDKLVIKRGLGPDLLEFVTFANKKRKKYNKSDGLTKAEIKKMLSNSK